ncbi:MAG: hypothetical protein K6B68_15420 [Eubacterium sp.]|nr:hypothetical protein [Eubacterium sp.]
MRGSRKLNLRDAAVFVLFLTIFFMVFPPLLFSADAAVAGASFYESMIGDTFHGVLIDWAVLTAVFITFLIEGRAKKKKLFMTFGFNQKSYYKQAFKQNTIKGIIFAVIRTIYLFIFSGNLYNCISYKDNQKEIDWTLGFIERVKADPDEYDYITENSDLLKIPEYVKSAHLVYDTDKVVVPILFLLVSSFMIYMILVMTKDIRDVREMAKKNEIAEGAELTGKKKVLRGIGNGAVSVHVILTWILCFMMTPLLYFGRVDTGSDTVNMKDYDYGVIREGYYFDSELNDFKEIISYVKEIEENYDDECTYVKDTYPGWTDLIDTMPQNRLSRTWIIILDLFDYFGFYTPVVTLPNGIRLGFGNYSQMIFMMILVISFVITWRIHKKKSFAIKDWVE